MTPPAPTNLCFLDITASHEERDLLLDVVRRTAEACFMPLTVGGGVRTLDDIRKLLLAGADKASIMTAAVHDRDFVRRGGGEIRQPVHCRRDRRQGSPRRAAGRSSPMAAATRPASTRSTTPGKSSALGAGEILLTSMDRDGAKCGFDIALTRAVADAVSSR